MVKVLLKSLQISALPEVFDVKPVLTVRTTVDSGTTPF